MPTAAHFIFYVGDQARSTRFYAAALAASPRLDVPGMSEFELAGGAILGLMPEAAIERLLGSALTPSGAAPGAARAELYLVVADPAFHHARALAAGGVELSPLQRRSWGHLVAYCRDPDGHVLAFAGDALHDPNAPGAGPMAV